MTQPLPCTVRDPRTRPCVRAGLMTPPRPCSARPKKLVRVTHDDSSPELYHMTNAPAKAEKMCRYDLDQQDSIWLGIFNGERARMGE